MLVDDVDSVATVAMIEKMLDEDSEIVTVMYGDSTEEEAQAVVDRLQLTKMMTANSKFTTVASQFTTS